MGSEEVGVVDVGGSVGSSVLGAVVGTLVEGGSIKETEACDSSTTDGADVRWKILLLLLEFRESLDSIMLDAVKSVIALFAFVSLEVLFQTMAPFPG